MAHGQIEPDDDGLLLDPQRLADGMAIRTKYFDDFFTARPRQASGRPSSPFAAPGVARAAMLHSIGMDLLHNRPRELLRRLRGPALY